MDCQHEWEDVLSRDTRLFLRQCRRCGRPCEFYLKGAMVLTSRDIEAVRHRLVLMAPPWSVDED